MSLTKKRVELRESKKEILELFAKAEVLFPSDSLKANDFVRKARNRAMKFRLKLPRDLRRKFCKHCYSFLVPGVNCRVRTHLGKVVYSCLVCKGFMRFQYK